MNKTLHLQNMAYWVFGLLLILVGVLNLWLVHPVPGIAYFLLSFLYLPPAQELLKKWFDFSIPLFFKIVLGVVIFFFTLGVSDLGDMLDKW